MPTPPARAFLRKALRIAAVAALGIAIGVGAVLLVGVVAGGREWTGEWLAATFGERSDRAAGALRRWSRCRGVERPRLANSAAAWELEYSWIGGYGAGDVRFLLSSDGRGTLRFAEGKEMQPPVEAQVDAARVLEIAEAVDELGLLCLEPIRRADHRIVDLGRYTIRVSSGGYRKEVFAGACFHVDDPEAFETVRDAIVGLADVFGDEISRGPYGITVLEGSCAE